MRIKQIKKGRTVNTYDIECKNYHNYQLSNGCISHNTSQLVNSSASILPVYSKFFTEKNKLMVVPFAAKYLSNETFWLYQEAINLDPNVVIEVCQNAQQWVDQGISMELVLNTNHYNDAKTLRDWYLKAMIGDGNKRSKTVYYLRPIQKGKEEGCTSCAN